MSRHGATHRDHAPHDRFSDARGMSARSHVRGSNVCAGKVWYPTKAKANRAKKACGRRFGMRFKVYRCAYCGNYHLTSVKDGAEGGFGNGIEGEAD